MVGNVLPEALEDGADMVPYSEFIIELTGGTGMLNIWPEEINVQWKIKVDYQSIIKGKKLLFFNADKNLDFIPLSRTTA